ncbi:MAG: hypothetical protein HY864_01275 [Chloroflexi bacterium]|nr:hypothetical protein [Chloroflexota bacterium]
MNMLIRSELLTVDHRLLTIDRGFSTQSPCGIVYRPLSMVCASSASNNPSTCLSPSDIIPEA